jgi:hypothetical protein
LTQLHNIVTGGHLGIKKTLSKVRETYSWLMQRQDVENWCRHCDICASKKRPNKKPHAPLQQYNVGAPLERIAVDILGPLPRTNKENRYLSVVGDYFSKWSEAIPIRDQEAITVNKLISWSTELFIYWACPWRFTLTKVLILSRRFSRKCVNF